MTPGEELFFTIALQLLPVSERREFLASIPQAGSKYKAFKWLRESLIHHFKEKIHVTRELRHVLKISGYTDDEIAEELKNAEPLVKEHSAETLETLVQREACYSNEVSNAFREDNFIFPGGQYGSITEFLNKTS